jgi:hypothetical protein
MSMFNVCVCVCVCTSYTHIFSMLVRVFLHKARVGFGIELDRAVALCVLLCSCTSLV